MSRRLTALVIGNAAYEHAGVLTNPTPRGGELDPLRIKLPFSTRSASTSKSPKFRPLQAHT